MVLLFLSRGIWRLIPFIATCHAMNSSCSFRYHQLAQYTQVTAHMMYLQVHGVTTPSPELNRLHGCMENTSVMFP